MKRHALFVGVDEYADPTVQDLRCAVNDAAELAGFFRHVAGFDRSEPLPNPRNCEVVLQRVDDLTKGLGDGDEFLFFFAGHGLKTPDGLRLVCAGDELSQVKRSWAGLPLERLKFMTSGPCNRLFVLDACRSDVLATNRGVAGAMEAGTRDIILGTAGPAGAPDGTLTILCSCDDGECAGEIPSLRHGLFSLAMLELLGEESSAGRRILLSDDFVYDRLPGRMRVLADQSNMDFRQKPQKRGPPILLLDGSASSPPPAPAPTLVACPICGKKNEPKDTFRCKGCGRDNLCLDHRDERSFLCGDCVKKASFKNLGNETHADETDERVSFPHGILIIIIIAALILFALVALSFRSKQTRNGNDTRSWSSLSDGKTTDENSVITKNDQNLLDAALNEVENLHREVAALRHSPEAVPASAPVSTVPSTQWKDQLQLSTEDLFQRGQRLYESGKYRECLPDLRQAAQLGHAEAQYHLGAMYIKGLGVSQNFSDGEFWTRKAADQGNAKAQCNLGLLYARGDYLPQNDAMAAEWFRKAAEKGNADSQYNLGIFYHNGRGVQQNDTMAAEWFRKAAAQGHEKAQKSLNQLNRRNVPIYKQPISNFIPDVGR